MALYSTEQAVDNSIAQLQDYTPENNGPLRSALFKNNEVLELLNTGRINEVYLVEHEALEEISQAIGKIQIALKIIIPKLTSASILGFLKTNKIDSFTKSLIQAFKQSKIELSNDDILDCETIHLIDHELNKIGWYETDFDTAGIIHDYSKWVNDDISKLTVVYNSNISSTTIYKRPEPGEANKIKDIAVPPFTPQDLKLPINHHVYVESPSGNGSWLLIHFEKDNRQYKGFVNRNHIWQAWGQDGNGVDRLPIPDPKAIIYKIPSGQTAYTLIKSKYFNNQNLSGVQKEEIEFYINVLLFANNRKVTDPQRGIYLNVSEGNDNIADIIADINDIDASSFADFISQLADKNELFKWTFDRDTESDYPLKIIKDKHIWLPDPSYMKTLYNYVNKNDSYFFDLYNDVRQGIMNYWPRGLGITLEGNIGITFCIPVRAEGGVYFHMWRVPTKNNEDIKIKIVKRYRVAAGVEPGIGAGFFAGSGKAKKSGSSAGFGAEIGAQASIMGAITILEEFEFDLIDVSTWQNANCKDLALVALFDSMTSLVGSPTMMSVANIIATANGYNIDPNRYMTLLKVNLDLEVAGSIQAQAGLRFGDDSYADTWNNVNGSTDNQGKILHEKGSPYSLSNFFGMLNVSAGLSANASIGFGLEFKPFYDPVNCIDPQTGWRVPQHVEISLFPSFSFFANANVSLLGIFGANFFNVDKQYEFHITFQLNINSTDIFELLKPQNILDNFEIKYIKFIRGSGELDYYLGPGQETSIVYNLNNTLNFASIFADIANKLFISNIQIVRTAGKVKNLKQIREGIRNLVGIVNQVEIKRRINTGLLIGVYKRRQLKKVLFQQDKARMLLPQDYKTLGIDFEHYLDLSVKFSGSDLEKLLVDFFDFVVEKIPSLTEISGADFTSRLVELIEGIRSDDFVEVMDEWESYFSKFISYVQKNSPMKLNIHSHALVGLKGATGFDAKLGPFKIGIDISGSVGITTDYTIITENKLDPFVKKYATQTFQTGLNEAELLMKEFFHNFLKELRMNLFQTGKQDFEVAKQLLKTGEQDLYIQE